MHRSMADVSHCLSSSSYNFNSLPINLVELILSLLPVPSLVRACAVCKFWRSVISAATFPTNPQDASHPWFFLYALRRRKHHSFAFDPHSNSWFSLPVDGSAGSGDGGFLFKTSIRSLAYTRLFHPTWRRVTSSLHFPRDDPLVVVLHNDPRNYRFVVAGGVEGGSHLPAEIYNHRSGAWQLSGPIPTVFPSSDKLSSAVFRDKLYVLDTSSCSVVSLDLSTRIWSGVRSLRPPDVVVSFVVACGGRLVLAGMCSGPSGKFFILWEVNEGSMELSKMAIMPRGLLSGLVDREEEEEEILGRLKCVGLGDLIYVFSNKECGGKKYPACVGEISGDTRKCRWRRLPDLPAPVNKFDKVVSFCSTVSI